MSLIVGMLVLFVVVALNTQRVGIRTYVSLAVGSTVIVAVYALHYFVFSTPSPPPLP